MIPRPVAIGLTLCDQVIVEEGTRKVSLIGTFSGFRATRFPFVPQPFCAVAALTDGFGDGRIDLRVDGEWVAQRHVPVNSVEDLP